MIMSCLLREPLAGAGCRWVELEKANSNEEVDEPWEQQA